MYVAVFTAIAVLVDVDVGVCVFVNVCVAVDAGGTVAVDVGLFTKLNAAVSAKSDCDRTTLLTLILIV